MTVTEYQKPESKTVRVVDKICLPNSDIEDKLIQRWIGFFFKPVQASQVIKSSYSENDLFTGQA